MKKEQWNEITADDVIAAIAIFDKEKPSFPEARSTFLIYKEKHYPAKHIRGLAYKVHFGQEISKSEYYGGDESKHFFEKLGFQVHKFTAKKGTTENPSSVNTRKMQKSEDPKMTGSTNQFLTLTIENIEKQNARVKESFEYGEEYSLINDCLNRFPLNDDVDIIAMKIALIDVTNSTQLSMHKQKISLYTLAKCIKEIENFDALVSQGDPDLVNIIARNTGSVNLFSFASKYCCYHNVDVYGRDDYSIFDSLVKEALPHYGHGLTENKIDSWRTGFDYKSFNDCIGQILDDADIHIEFRRRKFDHFLWYQKK